MKIRSLLTSLAIVLGLAAPAFAQTTCPDGKWRAEYFNNMTLTGTPVLVRCEDKIAYNWAANAPATGVNANQFSVRWTGRFFFTERTTRFSAWPDDGMRVRLDGALILDQWRDQSMREFTVDVPVTAGLHTVVVEYYENGGDAEAWLDWGAILNVSWQDNSDNETEFVLERCEGPGCTNFKEVQRFPANAESAKHAIVYYEVPGQTYRFQLKAINSAGISPPSNIAEYVAPVPLVVKVPNAPGQPKVQIINVQ